MKPQRKRDLMQVGITPMARHMIRSFGDEHAVQVALQFQEAAVDDTTRQYWVKVHDKIFNLSVAPRDDDPEEA